MGRVPHIKAKSLTDAFVALGFGHARDRLWQMEALLRRGTGRYAEWMGKSARAADILARQVDVACASKRDFDALTAEAQRAIDLPQERRTALISAAVTGKIDVRGLAESEAA